VYAYLGLLYTVENNAFCEEQALPSLNDQLSAKYSFVGFSCNLVKQFVRNRYKASVSSVKIGSLCDVILLRMSIALYELLPYFLKNLGGICQRVVSLGKAGKKL
jgi:hypothetical protein